LSTSITLPTLVGYSTRTGSARTTFVHRQRRQYEDPERQAFDFYRRPANAIRAGRASGRDAAAMTALLDQATARSRPHYEAVAAGWLRYLGRRKPELVDVGSARWHDGGVEVRVTPHLGLREANGSTFAVFLYFKELELTRDAADLILWLMSETMADLLPGAEPLVVDVRRSRRFAARHHNRPRVGAWVRSEVLAFLSLWDAAA
jgi:hypothetical protein